MCHVLLSMLDRSGGTGCDGVSFPVHSGRKSRDVSMAGVCDCSIVHIVCILILFGGVIWGLLVVYVEFLSLFQCWEM